jgi:hypothetical protein
LTVSLFVQVIVSPTSIVTEAGTNPLLVSATFFVAASADGASASASTAGISVKSRFIVVDPSST